MMDGTANQNNFAVKISAETAVKNVSTISPEVEMWETGFCLGSVQAEPWVYLDFLTRVMVAMLRGSRPNPFCECAILGLCTTFYSVMCDINWHMTTFDKGELTVLG